jgi:hypothetical protein
VKQTLLKFFIVFAVFALFSAVFKMMQKPGIYYRTLGKISTNYRCTGPVKQPVISNATIPYITITEQNAYNWDAYYFKDIRDKMYTGVNMSVPDRLAFYPFFPLIWKLLFIPSYHIIFLNFLFFGIALILLSQLLMAGKKYNMFFFILAFLLPSVIVFYLPYAESVFMLTLAVALTGLHKKKYRLYFIAMVCFSATRPATLFLMLAFLGTELVYLMRHRNIRHFLNHCGLAIAPVILGWLLVTLMQYFYTGSWTAYFDGDDLWPEETGFFNDIRDWSYHGFGMTVFAIFFVALPTLIYSIAWGIASLFGKGPGKRKTVSLFDGDLSGIKEYMFNLSAVFTAGTVIYYILTRSNALHGFYRYTMAVPFFYILFFLLPERLERYSARLKLVGLLLAFGLLVVFMLNIEYAGKLWRFEYAGLYLSLLIIPLILFEKKLSVQVKTIWVLLLIIPAIIWHTYLFNMYLSSAWIFT